MLRRALLLTLLWLAGAAQSGVAAADPCRTLHMVQRELGAQRANGASELREVRRRIATLGCGRGGRTETAPRGRRISQAPAPRRATRRVAVVQPVPQKLRPAARRRIDRAGPKAERRSKRRKPEPVREVEVASRPTERARAARKPSPKQMRATPARKPDAVEVPKKERVGKRPLELANLVEHSGPSRKGFPKGTFRTLCVRSCDGYYFPVSYSTTGEHFEKDQQVCRQMCPAGNVELFYHKVGEGSQEMVNLEGSRYMDLPAAFSYRTELFPDCGCQAAEIETVSIGKKPSELELVAELRAPVLPQPRPPPGEDPETLLNRAGALTPITHQSSARKPLASQRPGVRVIHPAWNETTVEVMQAPVPN